MKVLRPFLIVALSMTAPAAMAVTGDQQTPIRVSADLCHADVESRPRGCPSQDARTTQRTVGGTVSKNRKIVRMPWMIGAFQ